MSRLIDKLNQVSQAVPQVMGFRAVQPVSPKPRMLLIADLAQASVNRLADYVAGADAGLLHISNLGEGAKTLQEMCQVVSDIPWGGWLRDVGQGGMEQIVEAGCDFVVFLPANTPLAILQDIKLGKILQVEASLSEGLLKTVDELPVDAVVTAGEQEGEYFLTWHHLMIFQRLADLLTKPLLVSVPSNVTANELQTLWETGVEGVIVKVGVGQPEGRLKELRQVIDKLTFTSQRKRGKAEALLPYIGGKRGIVAEEEE
jgi:hypothetical protein